MPENLLIYFVLIIVDSAYHLGLGNLLKNINYMTIEDIRVGQRYNWCETPEHTFTVVRIEGELITWKHESSGEIVEGYHFKGLIDSVNGDHCCLISDSGVKYKMDRFKFV